MGGDGCVHPSIFGMAMYDPGTIKFDATHVCICFVAIIAFTMIVEAIIERIQHASRQSSRVWIEMSVKVGKELMILGLISFCIFAGREIVPAEHQEWLLPLEFAHVVILAAAVMYVLSSCYFVIGMRRACRIYDAALHSSPQALQKQLHARWGRPNAGTGSDEADGTPLRNQRGLLRGDRVRWRISKLCAAVELNIIAPIFIEEHNLPLDFDFGRYLKHSLEHAVGSTLDITPFSWLLLIVCICSAYGLGVVFETAWVGALDWDRKVWLQLVVFMSGGWILLLLSTLILFVSLRARSRIACRALAPSDPKSVDKSPFAMTAQAIVRMSQQSTRDGCATQRVQQHSEELAHSLNRGESSAPASNPHLSAGVKFSVMHGSKKINTKRTSTVQLERLPSKYNVLAQQAELKWVSSKNGEKLNSFPLRRRTIRQLVDFIFLCDCMYKAFLLCYFTAVAPDYGVWGWISFCFAVLPTMLNTLLVMPKVIEVFYFVYAVVSIQLPNLMQTLEDAAEAELLRNDILYKLRRLHARTAMSSMRGNLSQHSATQSIEWLRHCFNDWQAKQVNSRESNLPQLTMPQLDRVLVNELGIVLSNFQMRKLFRLFDKNQSGAVDFTEFLNFLLPTAQSAPEAIGGASNDGAEGTTADPEQASHANNMDAWTEVPLGVQWETVEDEQGRRRIVAKKHQKQTTGSTQFRVAVQSAARRSGATKAEQAAPLEVFTV